MVKSDSYCETWLRPTIFAWISMNIVIQKNNFEKWIINGWLMIKSYLHNKLYGWKFYGLYN